VQQVAALGAQCNVVFGCRSCGRISTCSLGRPHPTTGASPFGTTTTPGTTTRTSSSTTPTAGRQVATAVRPRATRTTGTM
jgi:hypothetical protein